MKPKIVLTGLVALVAFLWFFSYSTEITATELDTESTWKTITEKWSKNSMTLAIAIIAILLIGAILKSIAFIGISTVIVLVGAWIFWI